MEKVIKNGKQHVGDFMFHYHLLNYINLCGSFGCDGKMSCPFYLLKAGTGVTTATCLMQP